MAQLRRLELQQKLRAITNMVLFQPGETTTLKYPCILYDIEGEQALYADNARYRSLTRYAVTVIDTNPDSDLWHKVLELPHTELTNAMVSDQLYHWNITLYY